jgi:hypothetical protein
MRAYEDRLSPCNTSQYRERKRLERTWRLSGPNGVSEAQQLAQRRAGVRTCTWGRRLPESARHAARRGYEPIVRSTRPGARDAHARPRPSTRANHRLGIERPLRSAGGRRQDIVAQHVEARERPRAGAVGGMQRLANLKPPATAGHDESHTH